MHNSVTRILLPIFIGQLLVTIVPIPSGVEAGESSVGIQVNGLFYGDGDYLDHNFYAHSEPDERGFVYIKNAGSNQIYVLVRVSFEVNDNAFSPNKPSQDPYLASVDWHNPHDLGRLIVSDHMAIFLECRPGEPDHRWTWTQDL